MSYIKDTLWADYIKEREGFKVLETDYSFVFYKIRNNECFISHIYTEPESRKLGLVRDLIGDLSQIAIDNGCRHLIATISLEVGEPENTLKAALKIGFKIYEAKNNVLIIGMKLKEEK